MYEIKSLDDIYGNNVTLFSIKTLLERKSFPKLSIMSGVMGVGKSSVAKVVANMLDKSATPVKTYNCGILDNMQVLQDEVFSLNPAQPKVFIFEEIHSLSRANQNALLQMFDSQASNIYVICTTTEISRVLRTIRSRARVWEFHLLSEKQLAQLLDDYLEKREITLTERSKQSLLRSCHGVPRELINNTDFAIDGNFDAIQLDSVLGNVSDDLVYSVFVALKSNSVDFVNVLEDLVEDASKEKLDALNDFWLRFLLERSGGVRRTLSLQMVTSLNSLFTHDEILRITKVMLRLTPKTMMLELVNLNMIMTGTTDQVVVGQQIDKAREREQDSARQVRGAKEVAEGVQVSSTSLANFKL